jgi:hypothetical protein
MKTMKKHFLLVIVLLMGGAAAFAQSDKEDIAIAQAIFGKTKKAVIADHIQLNDQEKDGFWKLYDEYEGKATALGADHLKLIERYANQYNSLNDESASAIAESYLANNAGYTELYKEYFKKFKKQIGGLRAAELIQLEIYMRTAVQAQLQKQIPVIGEIVKQ